MSIQLNVLLAEIVEVVKGIVDEDWPQISSFAEKQGKLVANQATMIATSRTTGSLRNDEESFEFFMKHLEDMTRNLTQSIASLSIVTLEKAWNAVVGVIWGAINGALDGFGLAAVPIPVAPSVQ